MSFKKLTIFILFNLCISFAETTENKQDVKKSGFKAIFNDFGSVEDFAPLEAELTPTGYSAFLSSFSYGTSMYRSTPVLSPDDVWVTICQGIVKHVSLDPEKYRPLLVNYKGSKQISIDFELEKDKFGQPWNLLFKALRAKQSINSTKFANGLLEVEFSTTSTLDKDVLNMTFLALMSQYATFELNTFKIGDIKKRLKNKKHSKNTLTVIETEFLDFYLEGNSNDWQLLYDKLSELSELDLEWWTQSIKPVVSEFIKLADGKKASREFYSAMIDADVYIERIYYDRTQAVGWVHLLYPYCRAQIVLKDSSNDSANEIDDNFEADFEDDSEYGVGDYFDDELNHIGEGQLSEPFWIRNPFLMPKGQRDKSLNTDYLYWESGLSSFKINWNFLDEEVEMELFSGFVAAEENRKEGSIRPAIGWYVKEHGGFIPISNDFNLRPFFDDIASWIVDPATKVKITDLSRDENGNSVIVDLSDGKEEFLNLFIRDINLYNIWGRAENDFAGKLKIDLYQDNLYLTSFYFNDGMITPPIRNCFYSVLKDESVFKLTKWLLKHGIDLQLEKQKYLAKHKGEMIREKEVFSLTLEEIEELKKARYPIQKGVLASVQADGFFKEEKLDYGNGNYNAYFTSFWVQNEYETYGVLYDKDLMYTAEQHLEDFRDLYAAQFILKCEDELFLMKALPKFLSYGTFSEESVKKLKENLTSPVYQKLCDKVMNFVFDNQLFDEKTVMGLIHSDDKYVLDHFIVRLTKYIGEHGLEGLNEDTVSKLFDIIKDKDKTKVFEEVPESELAKFKVRILEYSIGKNVYIDNAFKFAFKGNHQAFLREFVKSVNWKNKPNKLHDLVEKSSRMTFYNSRSQAEKAVATITGKLQGLEDEKAKIKDAMFQNMLSDCNGKTVADNADLFWRRIEDKYGSISGYNRNFIHTSNYDYNIKDQKVKAYFLNSKGEPIYSESFSGVSIYPNIRDYNVAPEDYDNVKPKDMSLLEIEDGTVVALLEDQKKNQFLVKVKNGVLRKEKVPEATYVEEVAGDYLIFYNKKDMCGVMNQNFEIIKEAKYEYIDFLSGGLYCFEITIDDDSYWRERCGFLDENFNEVIPARFYSADWFIDGLATVTTKVDDEYLFGVINKKGQYVLEPSFDDLDQYESGLFRAEKDGLHGVIDKTGKEIVPIKYPVSVEWIDGYTVVDFGGKYGILDPKGEPVSLKID